VAKYDPNMTPVRRNAWRPPKKPKTPIHKGAGATPFLKTEANWSQFFTSSSVWK